MEHGWRGFEHLAPEGRGVEQEPFARWWSRVARELPHVPACVAEHWLHRNWGCSAYWWLPLDRLRFERQEWSNAEVLRIGEGEEPTWPRLWSDELGREDSVHRRSWLGWYMWKHRTWPAPILVLDNPDGLVAPDGRRLARRHLLEGRMRSAFHHHLATHGLALPRHEVWWATLA